MHRIRLRCIRRTIARTKTAHNASFPLLLPGCCALCTAAVNAWATTATVRMVKFHLCWMVSRHIYTYKCMSGSTPVQGGYYTDNSHCAFEVEQTSLLLRSLYRPRFKDFFRATFRTTYQYTTSTRIPTFKARQFVRGHLVESFGSPGLSCVLTLLLCRIRSYRVYFY